MAACDWSIRRRGDDVATFSGSTGPVNIWEVEAGRVLVLLCSIVMAFPAPALTHDVIRDANMQWRSRTCANSVAAYNPRSLYYELMGISWRCSVSFWHVCAYLPSASSVKVSCAFPFFCGWHVCCSVIYNNIYDTTIYNIITHPSNLI